MKRAELLAALHTAGAASVERATCYDGDPGRWRVLDAERRVVDLPIHPNELINRLAGLPGVSLRGCPHPTVDRLRREFETRHALALQTGGGVAFETAREQWARLCEDAGENERALEWNGAPG